MRQVLSVKHDEPYFVFLDLELRRGERKTHARIFDFRFDVRADIVVVHLTLTGVLAIELNREHASSKLIFRKREIGVRVALEDGIGIGVQANIEECERRSRGRIRARHLWHRFWQRRDLDDDLRVFRFG